MLADNSDGIQFSSSSDFFTALANVVSEGLLFARLLDSDKTPEIERLFKTLNKKKMMLEKYLLLFNN